jgi:protein involved in polysaccharide export with SLBB domain
VRGPGIYLVGSHVNLQDLVAAAGGAVRWADASGVELTSTVVESETGRANTLRQTLPLHEGMLASYIVKPHDDFRFNQIFTDVGSGTVTVQGEVRFTGVYQIMRGEHLSQLLLRCGGLTDVAYPFGTVFLRRSTAALEEDSFRRVAREIEDQFMVGMSRSSSTDRVDPAAFGAAQSFIAELRNQKALGRISIVADPSVLAARPELDPLLEAGDVIYIPQRPSTISVLGEVMQPGSFPLTSHDTSPSGYIAKAGGYSAFADESKTFIVLPDGTARPLRSSWLNFDSVNLPPGSAIVVPRDLTPLDLRQVLVDATTIFSQLAVAAASLSVITH